MRDNREFLRVEYVYCVCCGKEIPEHYTDEYNPGALGQVSCMDCVNDCPCVQFTDGQCEDCGADQSAYDAG